MFRALVAIAAILGSADVHAADGRPLVPVLFTDDMAPTSKRALRIVRAERSLARARAEYARSNFEACVRTLDDATRDVPAVATTDDGWGIAKRVELWRGLCLGAAGDDDGGALALARRLPGPDPEPGLLPPRIRARYEESIAATCTYTLPSGTNLMINGASAPDDSRLAPGVHLARWEDGGAVHTGWLTLAASCAPTLTEVADRSVAGLTASERADPGFLAAIAATVGEPGFIVLSATHPAARFDADSRATRPLNDDPAAASPSPLPWIVVGAGGAFVIAGAVAAVALAVAPPTFFAPPSTYGVGF